MVSVWGIEWCYSW